MILRSASSSLASASRQLLPHLQRHVRPSSSSSTVNADEIAFFSRLSSEWWDEQGEFKYLHRMNPPRVRFIVDKLRAAALEEELDGHPSQPTEAGRELAGLRALDIGCGGGLLSESLARLGARTLGIDASPSNVQMAALHLSADPALTSRVAYQHVSAEDLAREQAGQFDVVCAMEVLEHVDEPAQFLKAAGALVKPGGHLFLSTISRTPLAQLLTITLAEHVLREVSVGTHTYSKFVKPSELTSFFRSEVGWLSHAGGEGALLKRKEAEVRGIIYVPWKGVWEVAPEGAPGSTWANYLFWARKPREGEGKGR